MTLMMKNQRTIYHQTNDVIQKRKLAFDIAQKRFQNRLQLFNNENNKNNNNKNATTTTMGYNNLQDSPIKPNNPTHSNKLLNSIRIPEAGSSFLSVTARALVGCQPDGYVCFAGQVLPLSLLLFFMEQS